MTLPFTVGYPLGTADCSIVCSCGLTLIAHKGYRSENAVRMVLECVCGREVEAFKVNEHISHNLVDFGVPFAADSTTGDQ